MQAPALPANEQERLGALQALGILDTPPEARYSRFVRMIRRHLDVPIATISLIDANRQWFKGCEGLDVAETPRDISFCGHAILERGVFYIPDARADERFADNPLVTGAPHIRFYAGCPLYVPGNLALGTLCAIDTRPRTLSPEQLAQFRDIADCLQRELTMQVLMNDVRRLTSPHMLLASPAFLALSRAD
ncbi:MAG TPA: GAF domain-containing protein [Lysobacter sp.]